MQLAYVVIWWLVLFAIGLIAFPLVSRVCGRLPDRGYSASKIVGLVLFGFVSWLLASLNLLAFGYANLGVSLGLLLVVSLVAGARHLKPEELPWRRMLAGEAVFTLAFALFLVFVYYKPDIFYAYTEDFMDFAFVNAILRSDTFPPNDPWLAGEPLSYYYGGQLLVAQLTMLSRVPVEIGYNLASSMLFALSAVAAWGLGFGLTGRQRYGFLGLMLVCVAGFITGAFQLAGYLSGDEPTGLVDWLLTYDIGAQTIPHTANAYPYFVFLQAEVHAQTVAIPVELMYMALLLAMVRRGEGKQVDLRRDSVLKAGLLGLALGFLYLVNAWTFAGCLVLTLAAFALVRLDLMKRYLVLVLAFAFIPYLPFYLSTGAGGAEGVGLVAERTSLWVFLEAFALPLLPAFSMSCVLCRPGLLRKPLAIVVAVVAVVAVAVAFVFGLQIALVLLPLLLLALYGLWRSKRSPELGFTSLLLVVGSLILLGCEVLYVDDAYGGDFERFNTVLKFHLVAWVMLGLAATGATHLFLSSVNHKLRAAWLGMAALLLLACLIQPLGHTLGWTSGRQGAYGLNRGTLDGLAYVEELAPGDRSAIEWINENIEGSPVILEAPGATYQYTSRISTMTGLPTVIGWTTHEVMWRNSWEPVTDREADVNTVYSTPDDEEAIARIIKYNVEYVYVGDLEREQYEPVGLAKFDDRDDVYKLLYSADGARLYEVTAQ